MADDSERAKSPSIKVGTRCVRDVLAYSGSSFAPIARSSVLTSNESCFSVSAKGRHGIWGGELRVCKEKHGHDVALFLFADSSRYSQRFGTWLALQAGTQGQIGGEN